jgi:predicted nucleotidyltransferase
VTQTGAIDRLHELEPALRAAGIRALYLFGSTARAAAREDSDVDLLFEADPSRSFSLLDQARIQTQLAEALGRPVDLIEREALRPPMRRQAEGEMVRVF